MNIGAAAKASGISSKMIRHYEAIHLIDDSLRSDSGYRTYTEKDLHVLRFIKSARSLGFSLAQIKQLLSLWHDRSRASADVKALATEHINDLNIKINQLIVMRNLLQTLIEPCPGDERADCPILQRLESNLGNSSSSQQKLRQKSTHSKNQPN